MGRAPVPLHVHDTKPPNYAIGHEGAVIAAFGSPYTHDVVSQEPRIAQTRPHSGLNEKMRYQLDTFKINSG